METTLESERTSDFRAYFLEVKFCCSFVFVLVCFLDGISVASLLPPFHLQTAYQNDKYRQKILWQTSFLRLVTLSMAWKGCISLGTKEQQRSELYSEKVHTLGWLQNSHFHLNYLSQVWLCTVKESFMLALQFFGTYLAPFPPLFSQQYLNIYALMVFELCFSDPLTDSHLSLSSCITSAMRNSSSLSIKQTKNNSFSLLPMLQVNWKDNTFSLNIKKLHKLNSFFVLSQPLPKIQIVKE